MKIETVAKIVAANLHGKTEFVTQIRSFKQAINHGLVLKKVHWVIEFNQNALLKSYTDLRFFVKHRFKKKAKNYFEKKVCLSLWLSTFWEN